MYLYRRGRIWWVGYSENARRRRVPLHQFLKLSSPVRDKGTAQHLLASLTMKEIHQQLGVEHTEPTREIQQFYGEYFRFCDRNKTLTTIRADQYRFHRWLSYLEAHRVGYLSDISKGILNEFIQAELQQMSNATINKYVSIIRASLRWAVSQGYLRENPLRDVPRLAEKRPRRAASFHHGDLKRLFSINDEIFVAYLKVVYYTLMRLSEALNLRWDDVDLRRRLITIPETKSRRPRSVPISDKLLRVLKSLPKRGDRLFPGWQGHSVTTKFRRLRKKLNLRIDGIHHFRHLCASELLRKGANPRDVQELLGHTTSKTTMEIYALVSAESLRETVAKL
jgi:integrase